MCNKGNQMVALITMLVMFCGLNAQIGNYFSFFQSRTVYQNVMGTPLTDAMTDEGIAYSILLNFPFRYGLTTYSDFTVSSNGWLNLGSNLDQPYYANDLATLNLRPVLAPLWDDLGMENGIVKYYQSGTAPHRYCVVQWSAAHWNYQAANEYNFQVRMHETGQIDFIYGPHTGIPGTTASASIGINMAPGGPGYYYSVYPGYPAHVSSLSQMQTIYAPIADSTMYVFAHKTNTSCDAAVIDLYGPATPRRNSPATYYFTVGNIGLNGLGVDNYNVKLMRGDTVLAVRTVAATLPGVFVTENFQWTPDTAGAQQIYAKIDFPADMDSLNDASIPLNINVLPSVDNDDNINVTNPILLSAFPNPVHTGNSTIDFTLKQPAEIELAVYDLKGRKVRTLRHEFQASGQHQLTWSTTSDEGSLLANGIYFIRLSALGRTVTQKVIVLNAE